jgi:hypothetical protein
MSSCRRNTHRGNIDFGGKTNLTAKKQKFKVGAFADEVTLYL